MADKQEYSKPNQRLLGSSSQMAQQLPTQPQLTLSSKPSSPTDDQTVEELKSDQAQKVAALRNKNSEAPSAIGIKLAEELLVGDILTSDLDDLDGQDQQAVAMTQILLVAPVLTGPQIHPSGFSNGQNGPRSGHGRSEQERNNVTKGNVNEVLSPSRVLETSARSSEEDGKMPTASENPFDVVSGNSRGQDGSQQAMSEDTAKNDKGENGNSEDKTSAAQTQPEEENKESPNVADKSRQGLAVQKQRSNSVGDQSIANQVGKKKRRAFPILNFFGGQKTQEQPSEPSVPPQPQAQKTEETSSTVTQEKEDVTPTSKSSSKGGFLPQIFNKKKEKTQPEDEVIPAQPPQPQAQQSTASKPAGKQNIASRFVGLFKKHNKKPTATVTAEETKNVSPEKTVPVMKEEKVVPVGGTTEPAPTSSLDVGFREEEAFEDQALNIALNQEVEMKEAQGESSEDTNDEIYSAHEGLDFRPQANLNQFRFDAEDVTAATGQGAGTTTNTNPTATEGRQSLPTSGSNGTHEATDGRSTSSTGSFTQERVEGEEEEKNFPVDHPRYRSQSQNDDDLIQKNENSAENGGEEWEVYFPNNAQSQARNQPNLQQFPTFNSDGYSFGLREEKRFSADLGKPRFDFLSSGGAPTTAEGSYPFAPAGTGSEKLPFAISQASDDIFYQQNKQQHMLGRKSAVETPSTEKIIQEEVEKRSLRSLSGCNIGNNSEAQASKMRISAPFTPSATNPSLFTQPFNSNFGHELTNESHPDSVRAHGVEFKPGSNAMIEINKNGKITRYSESDLFLNPLNPFKTFSLARDLITSSRVSQPFTIAKVSHERNDSISSRQSQSSKNNPKRGVGQPSKGGASNNKSGQKYRHSNASSSKKSYGGGQNNEDGGSGAGRHRDSILSGSSNSQTSRGINRHREKKDQAKKESVQVLQCLCCARKSPTCLLEKEKTQFNVLKLEERVKSLIQCDLQLQHFMPIDHKKGGGSGVFSATTRSFDGRMREEIAHECCACCQGVRSTILHEMRGYASEFCRDQLSSKFIQVQLSKCQATAKATIEGFLQEICDDEENLLLNSEYTATRERPEQTQPQKTTQQQEDSDDALQSLMKNVFGNYVIQLIFDKGSQERINHLFEIMLGQLTDLTFDQFGCRIIQKALTMLPIAQKKQIVSKYDSKTLLEMMYSEEGNYVIQCIILNMPYKDILFLLPLTEDQVLELCIDKRGCRVIQRILEKFPRAVIDKQIIQKIIQEAGDLTPRQYGNYVITHILQHGPESEKIQIISAIIDNIVRFSLYQLGSNVVEHCIKSAPLLQRNEIIDRIIEVPVSTPKHSVDVSLADLLQNQFGNYVIQHALMLADADRKQVLYEKVEQAAKQGHVDRHGQYAKHVYSLLDSSHDFNSGGGDGRKSSFSQQTAEETKSGNSKRGGGAQRSSKNEGSATKTTTLTESSGRDKRQNNKDKFVKQQEDSGDESNEEDGLDDQEGKVDGQPGKRKRKRKRKRGTRRKGHLLCQEDILEEMSGSDRQQFLQELQSPDLFQTQSKGLFVGRGSSIQSDDTPSPAVIASSTQSLKLDDSAAAGTSSQPRQQSIFMDTTTTIMK